MSYFQEHGYGVVEDGYSSGDLQPGSDVDMDQDDEVDVENDDDEPEVEDGGGDDDEEDEEGEDEEDKDEIQSDEDDDDEEPIPSPRKQPRLRIRLKLGKRIGSSDENSTARPTPEVEATPSRAVRGRRKVKTKEIESEDSDTPESEDEDSGSRPPGHTKPMTARRAVLAGMVDSSHVALGEGRPSKKKILNETELALRREETARKRKNLTEKKLEDEKTETINRLLKKQTRPRNKRMATDDRSPMPSGGRKMKAKAKEEEGEEGEEENEEEVMDVVEEEVKPVMYRWTSSKKVDGETTSMVLSFSVPPTVAIKPASEFEPPKPRVPSMCAVEGCGQPRKYRLVKDWTIGACGMPHLKLLEG